MNNELKHNEKRKPHLVMGVMKRFFDLDLAMKLPILFCGMIFVVLIFTALRVVNDQIGTPTYTLDLSRLLVDMIEAEKYGYYHATNEGGYISWYDFACAIFKTAGMRVNVLPVTTAEYGESKAKRPFNSRLDKSKLKENGFQPLPTWQDALERYMENGREGNR